MTYALYNAEYFHSALESKYMYSVPTVCMDADSQSVCCFVCACIYVFVRLYECLCLDVPCVGIDLGSLSSRKLHY